MLEEGVDEGGGAADETDGILAASERLIDDGAMEGLSAIFDEQQRGMQPVLHDEESDASTDDDEAGHLSTGEHLRQVGSSARAVVRAYGLLRGWREAECAGTNEEVEFVAAVVVAYAGHALDTDFGTTPRSGEAVRRLAGVLVGPAAAGRWSAGRLGFPWSARSKLAGELHEWAACRPGVPLVVQLLGPPHVFDVRGLVRRLQPPAKGQMLGEYLLDAVTRATLLRASQWVADIRGVDAPAAGCEQAVEMLTTARAELGLDATQWRQPVAQLSEQAVQLAVHLLFPAEPGRGRRAAPSSPMARLMALSGDPTSDWRPVTRVFPAQGPAAHAGRARGRLRTSLVEADAMQRGAAMAQEALAAGAAELRGLVAGGADEANQSVQRCLTALEAAQRKVTRPPVHPEGPRFAKRPAQASEQQDARKGVAALRAWESGSEGRAVSVALRQGAPALLTVQEVMCVAAGQFPAGRAHGVRFPEGVATPVLPEAQSMRAEFSESQVSRALRRLDPSSSPGLLLYDPWHARMFARVEPRVVAELATLFSELLRLGCYPKAFSQLRATCVPKPGRGDQPPAKRLRVIAVANVLGRLFGRLLAASLTSMLGHVLHHGIMSVGVSDGAGQTARLVDVATACGRAVALVDIKDAYWHVPGDLAGQQLRCVLRHADDGWLRTLKAYLAGRSIAFDAEREDGIMEQTVVEVQDGVPIGDSLSAVLLALVLDPVLRATEAALRGDAQPDGDDPLHGHRLACYVDDVALIADSPEALQRGLDALERGLAGIGMALNRAKSYVLARGDMVRALRAAQFAHAAVEDGQPVPVRLVDLDASAELVLGVPIGNAKACARLVRAKAAAVMADLRTLGERVPVHMAVQAYKACLVKRLGYLMRASGHAEVHAELVRAQREHWEPFLLECIVGLDAGEGLAMLHVPTSMGGLGVEDYEVTAQTAAAAGVAMHMVAGSSTAAKVVRHYMLQHAADEADAISRPYRQLLAMGYCVTEGGALARTQADAQVATRPIASKGLQRVLTKAVVRNKYDAGWMDRCELNRMQRAVVAGQRDDPAVGSMLGGTLHGRGAVLGDAAALAYFSATLAGTVSTEGQMREAATRSWRDNVVCALCRTGTRFNPKYVAHARACPRNTGYHTTRVHDAVVAALGGIITNGALEGGRGAQAAARMLVTERAEHVNPLGKVNDLYIVVGTHGARLGGRPLAVGAHVHVDVVVPTTQSATGPISVRTAAQIKLRTCAPAAAAAGAVFVPFVVTDLGVLNKEARELLAMLARDASDPSGERRAAEQIIRLTAIQGSAYAEAAYFTLASVPPPGTGTHRRPGDPVPRPTGNRVQTSLLARLPTHLQNNKRQQAARAAELQHGADASSDEQSDEQSAGDAGAHERRESADDAGGSSHSQCGEVVVMVDEEREAAPRPSDDESEVVAAEDADAAEGCDEQPQSQSTQPRRSARLAGAHL